VAEPRWISSNVGQKGWNINMILTTKKRRESVTKKHIYFYNFFIIEKKNCLLYLKPEKSLLLTQITNMFLDNETEIGF
jgi:hypothetical protein